MLRRLQSCQLSRLLYLDYPERHGSGLVGEGVFEFDLEGIVAKWKNGSYIASDRRSSWVKMKNPNYSQIEGRAEMFDEQTGSQRSVQWKLRLRQIVSYSHFGALPLNTRTA